MDAEAAIAERIAKLGRPLLVALDVDGSLAPIVDDPSEARVPEATRALLERLEAVPQVHVALVTGRDARSLRSVVGPVHVWRAVSHGRVVLGPRESHAQAPLPPAEAKRLAAFEEWARGEAGSEGARIEVKDGAIAVHVRELAQRDAPAAEALLRRARERAEQEGLVARTGRAVCEAEVEAGDKGSALAKLIEATGAAGVVYAGDDLTDLPAIRLAVERGGVGIFVASGERKAPSEASVTVGGTSALTALLHHLADRLAGGTLRA